MALRCVLNRDSLLRVYTNPQIENVPDIDPWEAERYAPVLADGFLHYGIDNRRAVAHFLAQVGYETGCLNWLEEWDGRTQARTFGYGGGEDYYGRGTAMVTHKTNYAAIGRVMGIPTLADQPGQIGCKKDDPEEWPRNVRMCLESGMAFWKLKGFDQYARLGDAGFEPIMLRWLGTIDSPSYRDRWRLYRAMIRKLPRPLFTEQKEAR